MDVQTIKLSARSVIGKKVKQLRREGIVSVHIYGSDIEPMSLQSDAKTLRRLLPRVGSNIPLSVDVEGLEGENICFVREVQRHPVSEDVLHVDFLRVDVSQPITAEVPIIVTGNSPAVRQMGGTLLQPILSVQIESLPMNVPASAEVDISGLDDFEKGLYVSDLSLPSNVTVLTDTEQLIARVGAPRIEAVTEVEEGVEGVEGEVAEGEEGEASDGEASEG